MEFLSEFKNRLPLQGMKQHHQKLKQNNERCDNNTLSRQIIQNYFGNAMQLSKTLKYSHSINIYANFNESTNSFTDK